ncbi:MAG: 4-coumarate--CoA ligase family protein [bacterium]
MIIRSPYPDVTIPEISLPEYVLRRAAELGGRPALIEGPSGRVVTYADLAAGIRKTAVGLAKLGFKKGDVFAIYSPNLPEYAFVFHAVATLGGISTTVNPLYTADELAKQLRDSRARFMITVPPFLENAQAAAKNSDVEKIFVFGEAEGATPFAELMAEDGEPPKVEINPKEDLVVLPYSSGTTGLPKGVMLTHHNLVDNLCQFDGIEDISPYTEEDTLIAFLPFFHIYGLIVILNVGLASGASLVTMPRFDLQQFLELMQKYEVTFAHLVPPIVLALAKHPMVDNYKFPKLRGLLSGAAPLGVGLTNEVSKRLNVVVVQGYGLTETSPVTHISPDIAEKIKPGSIGHCVPNTEIRIVDTETGEDLGPGKDGELLVRGPQVMKGYLNNPEATAEAIQNDWFHTGDIGHIDEDGYFYIVDRLKEMIKYKGYQVAPAELEALLLTHPAVGDAAVIAKADDEAGEIPKAFVVKKSEVNAEEIMAFIADKVAPQKRIRALEFVEEIPKSASGKILRRVLVEKERAAAQSG